jgi:hypothetical protein
LSIYTRIPEGSPDCETPNSGVACANRKVQSSLQICEQTSDDPLTCTERQKTCSEAQSLTDIDCKQLATDNIICITGNTGCVTPTTCDEVISGASEAICNKFDNCEYKAANSDGETNDKPHCKSISTPQGCAITLDETDGQEEICNARPKADGALCYFDGDKSCKEATKCEDIEYAEGKSVPQTKCDTYNTDTTTAQNKCVSSDNKCILIF